MYSRFALCYLLDSSGIRSQEWQTFCDFPQITDISIKRLSQEQMPLEGRVVTLTRQDDQCMVVALHKCNIF